MYKSFIHTSHSVLSEGCSALLYQDILSLSEKQHIVLGFSGGTSLDIFLDDMRDMLLGLPPDLQSKLLFVLVDERAVEVSDAESNFGALDTKLFRSLVASGKFDSIQYIAIDIHAEDIAIDYTQRVPHIDIAFFGVGEDGHIASLFPDHPLLLSEKKGFLQITDSPKPPSHRITISPDMIREMWRAYIFFIGDKKQQAYSRFLDETMTELECPAKLIHRAERFACFSDRSI